jgi:hypothetical protein
MKRLLYATIRRIAYPHKWLKLYYWADKKMFGLPPPEVTLCYRWMVKVAMAMIHWKWKRAHKMGDWLIHRVPFSVRFKLI